MRGKRRVLNSVVSNVSMQQTPTFPSFRMACWWRPIKLNEGPTINSFLSAEYLTKIAFRLMSLGEPCKSFGVTMSPELFHVLYIKYIWYMSYKSCFFNSFLVLPEDQKLFLNRPRKTLSCVCRIRFHPSFNSGTAAGRRKGGPSGAVQERDCRR